MTLGVPLDRKWLLTAGAASAILLFSVLMPHIERLKVDPRESSAAASLRTIFLKQEAYRSRHRCFANDLAHLPDFAPQTHDYVYTLQPTFSISTGCVSKYVATASPAVPGKSGRRYFTIDQDGIIHFELMHPVNSQSPVLE